MQSVPKGLQWCHARSNGLSHGSDECDVGQQHEEGPDKVGPVRVALYRDVAISDSGQRDGSKVNGREPSGVRFAINLVRANVGFVGNMTE